MAQKKSHTVRSADDDLMSVAPPKAPTEGRCVPLATGAMALPVCRGEQHKAEGYEYRFGEDDAPETPGKAEDTEKREEEETSGDE
ncbi:hypothetical protein LPW11_03275 [Geomonas sp. RF6]|uniref:hypothetical protein n=1 Tax=Geomonas sp. RF6 TaxID=2897342 RepID=UPI001E3A60FD|nr:hypothetical protein [Geomonas sp. RF6]UFS71220.1 hypothetical protein LPW11_03275 [Geomonas sp. RF6]